MSETEVAQTVIENGSPKKQISPTKEAIDTSQKAYNLLAQGKRHLLVNDVNSAVTALGESCRILAAEFGETAIECGESYFSYGTALLEMARIESGVLGNALDGVPEGDDANNSQVEDPEMLSEDQKDEVREKVGEALEQNFKETEVAKTNGHSDKPKENGVAEDKENVAPDTMEARDEVMDIDEKESTECAEEIKTDELSKDTEEIKADELSKNTEEIKADELSKNTEEIKADELSKDTKINTGDAERRVMDDKEQKSKETKDKSGGKGSETPEDEDSAEEENEDDDEEKEAEEGEEKTEEADAEDGEKTEEEDEVTSLQLAWEVLELAKVIYEKDPGDHSQKISQIYLKLGEVGMENENYEQSTADIKACLEIQKKTLKPDDRCLAETYYQLGVAYSYSDDFDASMESFNLASKVIEDRISNLKEIKTEKEQWTKEQKDHDAATRKDPFYSEDREIEELLSLLPEIKEKTADMAQMKKDSKEKLAKAKIAAFASMLGGAGTSTGFGEATSSKELTPIQTSSKSSSLDINHLVRKKRKPEEEVLANTAKKTKMENGEAKAVTNGIHQEKVEETAESKMETA